MAIQQSICLSYLAECLAGIHAAGDTYKIALFTSAATLDETTTAYAATNEVANGNGYTTGGETLANFTIAIDGSTVKVTFDDPVWLAATFTFRGALIYNSSKANRAVCVKDFGTDKTVSGGTLTIDFQTTAAQAPIFINLIP